jgi:hypothetical protein
MEVKGKIPLMTNHRRKGRNQSTMRTGKSHLPKRRRRKKQSLKLKEPHRRIKVKKMRGRRKRNMRERGLKSL